MNLDPGSYYEDLHRERYERDILERAKAVRIERERAETEYLRQTSQLAESCAANGHVLVADESVCPRCDTPYFERS